MKKLLRNLLITCSFGAFTAGCHGQFTTDPPGLVPGNAPAWSTDVPAVRTNCQPFIGWADDTNVIVVTALVTNYQSFYTETNFIGTYRYLTNVSGPYGPNDVLRIFTNSATHAALQQARQGGGSSAALAYPNSPDPYRRALYGAGWNPPTAWFDPLSNTLLATSYWGRVYLDGFDHHPPGLINQ